MTIKDDDREILIHHRINKAEALIEEVQSLIRNKHYVTAVNRIYYGMFYILSALALRNKFATAKHQQLIGWFNKNFIKEKIIDDKFGRIINTAYEMRIKGDYDDFIEYDLQIVENLYSDMKDFISQIKKLVI
jgi:uncharacterized protein